MTSITKRTVSFLLKNPPNNGDVAEREKALLALDSILNKVYVDENWQSDKVYYFFHSVDIIFIGMGGHYYDLNLISMAMKKN